MGHAWLYVLFLFSSVISGFAQVSNRASVILIHNGPLIYKGELVYLQCRITGGEGPKWTYEWRPTRLNEPKTSNGYIVIQSANETHSGGYSCRGTNGSDSTAWSDVVVLTVYKLSVSPSWLSPGASVNLSCEVQHPPAGTRFFWYKAVPKPPGNLYSYELLPGSANGTDDNVYIVHGLNNTAGYVCEAGNGDLKYRHPSFVWSADPHPAASLSVKPDRVQHFRSESESLSCEGNSTGWRMMRFTETDSVSDCYRWGRITGSTCTINMNQSRSGVFWCESRSGEFSNAINITVQDIKNNIILLSPVHPVTEGDPVTLRCRNKDQQLLSNVFFYHNDKLLQNDSREELNISAVSKSDEGFYKCQHSGKDSPRSWMSVRVSVSSSLSSSFPVMLIVGPVVVFLIILLLSWWRCSRSKNSWCIRSEVSSQSSSTNQGLNQTESQVYSSLLHGDTSEYETIQAASNNRRPVNPEDDHIYTNVNRKHR
ncbi:uncharacterized protein LOC103475910 [Poecilia reticulata]|uniref:uncharacterized protein LOC103475910 n=1 Tax=Poecilia reticulata TaxID=8081 RepID=UPI0007E9824C|nr:PREDICTED: uncharacterized protein LOC103475910 [Poecilia reticulata]